VCPCNLLASSGPLWRSNASVVVLILSYRVGSRASSAVSFGHEMRRSSVSRSFAWPMTRHTTLPQASALRKVVRARLGGLQALTAPRPQYHNLERWPAAALSLNYHEGAAMLPSEAATPGFGS